MKAPKGGPYKTPPTVHYHDKVTKTVCNRSSPFMLISYRKADVTCKCCRSFLGEYVKPNLQGSIKQNDVRIK